MIIIVFLQMGFPGGSAGKESACNVGDLGFDPWVGKIPWRRERLPAPVFWPGLQRVRNISVTFTFSFHR